MLNRMALKSPNREIILWNFGFATRRREQNFLRDSTRESKHNISPLFNQILLDRFHLHFWCFDNLFEPSCSDHRNDLLKL